MTRLPLRNARRPVFAVHARGPLGRWMRARGWAGFTLPLPFVTIVFFWLRPGEDPSPRVVLHEAAHCVQIEEHGLLPFVLGYLRDLARHGYAALPFEVAARRCEAVAALDADLLRAALRDPRPPPPT